MLRRMRCVVHRLVWGSKFIRFFFCLHHVSYIVHHISKSHLSEMLAAIRSVHVFSW